MKLIVTRPLAQAADWVRRLQDLGQPAQALPLIHIAALEDAAPLHAAWQALTGALTAPLPATLASHALVMFVSANAVQHFFAAAPATGWPAGVRAGSTGPGTSAALRAAGVPEALLTEPGPDAPTFDSEALWSRLKHEPWAGRRVLVVRGEDGRDWLADVLRERGSEVSFVAAYRRLPPQLDAVARALLHEALADPQSHCWHFSSSEAVVHLQALGKAQAPAADWRHSRALASHPRIEQAARAAGFGKVDTVAPSAHTVAAWLARDVSAAPAARP